MGKKGLNPAFAFLLALLALLPGESVSSPDIVGCGGFVKSPYKLDFDKIEIKLFTKQGSLKVKTECAPTTGYYFIPLENKGDYVLKISPPEGWSFDPPEVQVSYDGEGKDPCSQGKDIDFTFKGFSIKGTVVSAGFKGVGPPGVGLELRGPNGLVLKEVSGPGGSFSFPSIPPGSYSLKASKKDLRFEKDAYNFEITNKNVLVDGQIVVSGYQILGKVTSDGNPVEKVSVVLLSEDTGVSVPKACAGANAKLEDGSISQKGKVICVQSSGKDGNFAFDGLTPGKYSVVPVYKGTNIVYNVSPTVQEILLEHGSAHLPKAFEVQGFTVQGKVKGHSGAKVFVNGVMKATSGHDGSFSIANMKAGTYEFEVTADKFLFDKQRFNIQPTAPVIPDFVPSKFQTCGTITVAKSLKISSPEITVVLQKTGSSEVVREKVSDLRNACVYLPQGTFSVWLESNPEKYFIPDKSTIQIPSGSRFNFQEFSGSISGSVKCQFGPCNGIRVQVEASGNLLQEKAVGPDGKFSFEDLESGIYKLKVDGSLLCWKSDTIDVTLKNSNVDGLSFVQTGIPLEVSSTHSTTVKVVGKSSVQKIELKGSVPEKICLSDPNSSPESYKIIPEGCHGFVQTEYAFTPGQRLELRAVKHQHTWKINAPSAVSDLKVTRNGETFEIGTASSEVRIVQLSPGKYQISSMEEPDSSPEWQVFSYGFIFEPSSFRINTLPECSDDLLEVTAKQSHVIKGKFIPAIEGVQVRIELVGDSDSTVTVTSNALGEYIAGPFVHSSGFKVTPTLTGYTFKPLSNDPYSFSVSQLAKIHVVVESKSKSDPSPVSLSGALLSLSGPSSYRQNKITDENGEMVFTELQPGQYYLKALLKEFQFLPSAINIDLKEQETKKVTLQAIRESFSLYGQLGSLSGEAMPEILVRAKGVGNCSEYGEEGVSDERGNFRIWALKSYCNYEISIVKKDEFTSKVERTIPSLLNVKVGEEDIHNVSFIVITPVKRMDVSLHCYTNNEKAWDHLKALVYSTKNMDVPIHSSPFNGVPYIILPPITKDDEEYVISFESTLNKFQYHYQLPKDIIFSADKAYAHFSVEFNVFPAPVEQDIGKNSYIAFAMIVLTVCAIANYEKLGGYLKDFIENYSSQGAQVGKKSKSKTK